MALAQPNCLVKATRFPIKRLSFKDLFGGLPLKHLETMHFLRNLVFHDMSIYQVIVTIDYFIYNNDDST